MNDALRVHNSVKSTSLSNQQTWANIMPKIVAFKWNSWQQNLMHKSNATPRWQAETFILHFSRCLQFLLDTLLDYIACQSIWLTRKSIKLVFSSGNCFSMRQNRLGWKRLVLSCCKCTSMCFLPQHFSSKCFQWNMTGLLLSPLSNERRTTRFGREVATLRQFSQPEAVPNATIYSEGPWN